MVVGKVVAPVGITGRAISSARLTVGFRRINAELILKVGLSNWHGKVDWYCSDQKALSKDGQNKTARPVYLLLGWDRLQALPPDKAEKRERPYQDNHTSCSSNAYITGVIRSRHSYFEDSPCLAPFHGSRRRTSLGGNGCPVWPPRILVYYRHDAFDFRISAIKHGVPPVPFPTIFAAQRSEVTHYGRTLPKQTSSTMIYNTSDFPFPSGLLFITIANESESIRYSTRNRLRCQLKLQVVLCREFLQTC